MTSLTNQIIPAVKVTDLDLEMVKNYLRIDYDYDDAFISTILSSSKSFIQYYLNKKFSDFEELPDEFTIACLAICGHWYENRKIESSGAAMKEISYIFSGILDMHRDWLGDVFS